MLKDEDMLTKLLTFLGAGIAMFIWGRLITSLDVSAPKEPESVVAPIVVSMIVALFFIGVHVALRRSDRDRYLGLVLDVVLVSFVGSFTLLVLFFGVIIIAFWETLEIRYISIELFSIIFLGVLLFISTFVCILTLRTIAHCIKLSKHNVFQ